MASGSPKRLPKDHIKIQCIPFVSVKGETKSHGKRFVVETSTSPTPALSAPQRTGVLACHLNANDLSYGLPASSSNLPSPSPSTSPCPSDGGSIQSSPGVDRRGKWYKVYDTYKQSIANAKKFANDISELPDGLIVALGVTDTATKFTFEQSEVQMFYDALGLLGASDDVREKFPLGYRIPWIFVGVVGAPRGSAYLASGKQSEELDVVVKFHRASQKFIEVSCTASTYVIPGRLPIQDTASASCSVSALSTGNGRQIAGSIADKASAVAQPAPVAKSKLLLEARKSQPSFGSDVEICKSPKRDASPKSAASFKGSVSVKRAGSEDLKSSKKQCIQKPQRLYMNESAACAEPSKQEKSPRSRRGPKSPKILKHQLTENWLASFPYLKMVQDLTGFQTHEKHANFMGYPQAQRWQHEIRRFYPTVEIEMETGPPEKYLFRARELGRSSARELGVESAQSKRFRESGQLCLATRALIASIPSKDCQGSMNGFHGVVDTVMAMKPLMRSKVLTHYPIFHHLTALLMDMIPKFSLNANVSSNQCNIVFMVMKGIMDVATEAIRNLPRVCRMLIDGEAEIKKMTTAMKTIVAVMAKQNQWAACKCELQKTISILEDPEKLELLRKNLEDIRTAREEKKIADPKEYYIRKAAEKKAAREAGAEALEGDDDVDMAEGESGAVAPAACDPCTIVSDMDPSDPCDTTIEKRLADNAVVGSSQHPRVIAGGHGWLVIEKPTGWESQCRRKHEDIAYEQYKTNVAEKSKIDLQYYIVFELSKHLPFLKEMQLMPPVAKKSSGSMSHFGQLFPLDADTSGLVLLATRPSSLPLLRD